MEANVHHIADVYRKFSRVPIPAKGYLLFNRPAFCQVNVINNHRDLERSETVKSLRTFTLCKKTSDVVATHPPVDITTEQLRACTKDGDKIAILRLIKLGKNEEIQYIEVWKGAEKIINLDLKALDLHGKAYEDQQFGCLQWSSDEKKVVYIAEKKLPPTESFFKTKAENARESPETHPGNEHIYAEDWGEALVDKCRPTPFVVDVEENKIKSLNILPGNISFGQAVWTPENNILCVGWWHEPRKLGLTYCTNRRSALFHLKCNEDKYEIIGPANKTVSSPRFSADGSLLVYLEKEVGGPHNKTSKLMMCTWATKQIDILVDVVNTATGDSFPGIYVVRLPPQIWSNDNNWLVFNSIWRSREELVCVNVRSKNVSKLTSEWPNHSWNLLDFSDNFILAAVSSPNLEPICVIGKFSHPDQEIKWTLLWEAQHISNINWNILKFKPIAKTVHPSYPELQYEAIYVQPVKKPIPIDGFPLIVWPHGGPHSTHLTAFNNYVAVLATFGFSLLMVNFRGSLGFGEDSINSLLGNVGVNDVGDCQNAAQNAGPNINTNKIVVFGGSHGGFLSAHLIGQFPDFYKACACRNPVVDISSLLSVTDIPDWSWVESGSSYTFRAISNPRDVKNMWEKSPMKLVDEIKTPVLLLVGKRDLRVPPSQSYLLQHALKARNKVVKMLTYEDNHSLSKVDVEADVFMNTILWFFNHLNY